MSYCVNCGVELDEGEQRCPLCSTPVVNPNHPCNSEAPPAYPRRMQEESPSLLSRRSVAAIISASLLLPACICLVCNFIIGGKIDWSVYVLLALGVLWVASVPPLLIRRGTLLWSIGLDVAAIGGLLYVTNYLTSYVTHTDWFFPLALPLLLLGAFVAIIVAAAFRYWHPGKLYGTVICLLSAALLLVGIEVITNQYLSKAPGLHWSLGVLIPCLILALFCIVVGRKLRLRNQMKKKLHW